MKLQNDWRYFQKGVASLRSDAGSGVCEAEWLVVRIDTACAEDVPEKEWSVSLPWGAYTAAKQWVRSRTQLPSFPGTCRTSWAGPFFSWNSGVCSLS